MNNAFAFAASNRRGNNFLISSLSSLLFSSLQASFFPNHYKFSLSFSTLSSTTEEWGMKKKTIIIVFHRLMPYMHIIILIFNFSWIISKQRGNKSIYVLILYSLIRSWNKSVRPCENGWWIEFFMLCYVMLCYKANSYYDY